MYKRNQVEWAIWQTLDRGQITADEPPASVVNTLRRLIDVDRKLWPNTRAAQPWQHRFAFIEGMPQGRGGENNYRVEEVVLLWLALQYLAMGFPQTETVQFLRRIKPALNIEVRRVLAAEKDQIARAAQERGQTARALRNRTFLPAESQICVISSAVSGLGGPTKLSPIGHGSAETLEKIEAYMKAEGRTVLLEIANPTVSLAYFLALSPLMKRGRAPSA